MSDDRQSPSEALADLALRLRAEAPVEPNEDRAVTMLADAVTSVARDESLVAPLVTSTGLSAPMVRWALRTTAESFTAEALHALRERALGPSLERQTRSRQTRSRQTRNRMGLATIVLAGNVFTACLRPIVLSLLFEVPTLVRASSRDALLAEAFARALPPPFDAACAVRTFARDDDACWEAFFRHADAAHVYGGDETLRAIRARLPVHTRFVGHGHGLGVAVVRASSFDERAAEALSLDVAAYDQRGCLSPQEVLVLGTHDDASAVVERLMPALEACARTLPRGPLPADVAAAARRWRDVALAVGELREAATHAVALDPTSMLPLGPGHRHLVVRALGPDELATRLANHGRHLKALGLGEPGLLTAPMGTAPRVCPLGGMQTPPFDAALDGLPPTEGFLSLLSAR